MPTWTLAYNDYDPKQESLRETLCALGNGYFCTRGAAEWADADEDIHYPGTYLAGGYNRLVTEVADRPVENEDLVNMPNWLCLTFRIENGDWFDPGKVKLLYYRQRLNTREGMLTRAMRFRDAGGRETSFKSRRIVHMGKRNLAAIEWSLTPENWTGKIEVRSAIDGRVINSGVKRYRQLKSKHLMPLDSGSFAGNGIYVFVRTTQAHRLIAEAARTRIFERKNPIQAKVKTVVDEAFAAQHFVFEVSKGTEYRIEKVVALYTSQDRAISEPVLEAKTAVGMAGDFDELLRTHRLAWDLLWRRCHIALTSSKEQQDDSRNYQDSAVSPASTDSSGTGSPATESSWEATDRALSRGSFVTGDSSGTGASSSPSAASQLSQEAEDSQQIDLTDTEHMQMILRVHIFHLLQTVSRNTVDLDVGVPARGLHGEAYRGHIFWDELFIFPFLTFRLPEITHALLLYRYRRLDKARAMAARAGYRGAMFPWQSGSDGREETQQMHLNPKSGRWIPDLSHNQRHVNIAIAYNIRQYHQITGDWVFMSVFGAEMLLEIARFWASIAKYNPGRDRYEIHGVMGPDEYHDKYVDADKGGLSNNAYTNVMVSWVLDAALRTLDGLLGYRQKEIREILDLGDHEISLWAEISKKMYVPFHDGDIISQFEGYEKLKDFDWEGYRKKYGDIQRLDRILEAEGDTPNRYKVSKQADVLMLFYLLSSADLKRIFDRLDYPFDPQSIPRNIEYYMRRTSHGSTLSNIVHSGVIARCDRSGSWRMFRDALESDLGDIQRGTTPEGIHLGAMAGTVDLIQRCYSGMAIQDGVLCFNPLLPDQLKRLEFSVRFRGMWLDIALTANKLTVSVRKGWMETVKIGVRDTIRFLKAGCTCEFDI